MIECVRKRSRTPFSPCRVAVSVNIFCPLSFRTLGGMYSECGEMFLTHVFLFNLRRCKTISAKDLLINEAIKAKEVRVVGPDGEAIGVMQYDAALKKAYDAGLDFVLAGTAGNRPCAYHGLRQIPFTREGKGKKKKKIIEITESAFIVLIRTTRDS